MQARIERLQAAYKSHHYWSIKTEKRESKVFSMSNERFFLDHHRVFSLLYNAKQKAKVVSP
jgi:hypothetical protein